MALRLLIGSRFCLAPSKDDGAGSGSGEEDRGDEAIRMALTALQPLAGQLGFGGFMGYCSGYAAKKIGKLAAFGTGCTFLMLQGLAYAGLIEIKWKEIQEKVNEIMDTNGDGKLSVDDAMHVWIKYVKPVLTFYMPGAGGFSLGFLLGVKSG